MDLKLFECRILWEDAKGISRFTLLHTGKSSAEATIYERLDELGYSGKDISKMVIIQFTSFRPGQIIHEEFQYMSPNEFKSKDR